MTICKNCNTSFEGKHCPECGQKANTHRFTVGHLAHEIFHAVTHTDKGILFLIKELAYRPGYVAREYNAGLRKKYFNPFTFLLIAVAFQLFVLKQTHFYEHFIDGMKKFQTEIETSLGAKVKPGTPEVSEATKSAEKSMVMLEENSRTLTFAFIPFIAFLTWLLFRKSGHNYAENLVMQTFLFGENTLFFLVIVIPFLLDHSLYPFVLVASFALQIVYNTTVYKQFFQQGWWSTIWKSFVILILYLIFSNLAVSAATQLIALLK
jgi:hypothetical protein